MEFNATEMKELNGALKKAFDEMQENVKKVQDTAMKALEETRAEGTLHKKTSEELTKLGEAGNKLSESVKELQTRTLEVEQKLVKNPRGEDTGQYKSIGQIVAESDEWKAASKNPKVGQMQPVTVGSFHKTNVLNVNP